ncbi:hypothetical protein RclHR1_15700005 [Rhizophagus clarus]|uniref:F-box domain-containing protein n=1 Tax=Rhizophagus clarus TaxID=94130 RepID=A0A2Z6R8L7_9GLOM|nr:hypothetical protein RclHR1_15700005 [Rhizophagus clarus]
MTCSKIFSGELTELLSEIIQYFQNDFSTLHSCILVNRLWCRLAIPLLWENPFSIINYYPTENYRFRFIETYLVNLNDNDKTELNEHAYEVKLLSNTLFNYPSFIKHLDTRIIDYSITGWVVDIKKLKFERPRRRNDSTQYLNFRKFTYKSLIKIFIENESNLRTFNFAYYMDHLDINSNISPLVKLLCSNHDSISSFYRPRFEEENIAISKYLSQLIKLQKNLKKILFNYEFSHLVLLNCNCTNTLNTIIFYNIRFQDINVLYEVFEQLTVLESIHIFYCHYLDFNFIQQIIKLTKPFKLKSLFGELKMFESIELLLQKSGDYLENFGFEYPHIYDANEERKSQLLKLVTKYCTKIKFFELLTGLISQGVINLIESVAQNLNYLTIDLNVIVISKSAVEISSNVLQILGQILPFKLEYFEKFSKYFY